MLGWFKKKFSKQKDTAPTIDTSVEEQKTETFSEEELPAEKVTELQESSPETPEMVEDVEAKEEITSAAHQTEPATEPELKSPEPASEHEEEGEEGDTGTVATSLVDDLANIEEIPPSPPVLEDNISDVVESSENKKKSLFTRLSDRLGKTRETFTYQIDALFLGKKEIDADLLDDLEEILITADLGVGTTEELLDYARQKVSRKELSDPNSLKAFLKERIKSFILENETDASLVMPKKGPFVIMVIGVNGVGKTTTIGKIANKFLKSGSSVMLVAGDTFRAAAVSQLKIWGERNNVPVIAHKDGADPSSVVFDAIGIAKAEDIDVVLVDTAGRMHTKDNLMEELKKIKRVMGKKLAGAPHEIMLVIDATTGQNGVSQARLFDSAVHVTGLTLTKLDGTSKGGIVANICREMKIPIRFIGIGEQMDDLRDFDANEFVDALFQGDETTNQ